MKLHFIQGEKVNNLIDRLYCVFFKIKHLLKRTERFLEFIVLCLNCYIFNGKRKSGIIHITTCYQFNYLQTQESSLMIISGSLNKKN